MKIDEVINHFVQNNYKPFQKEVIQTSMSLG